MTSFNYKLEKELLPKINNINNIKILELGVQKGRSTLEFLKICEKKNGKLYSVDIDDCSDVSKDPNWKFIKSRDDNFEYIKSEVPKEIDVLLIDTIHEASHVKKILLSYYDLIKAGGYIFVDDISHLPYLKNSQRNNFYCEINNQETLKMLLEIYSENSENIDISFSFISSGLAIIKKKTDKNLNQSKKLYFREFSIKNFSRKLWKKIRRS
tara:strand:- start:368 stop:1000 length:633 start_codon:yes stop_codon:yes gene_type:complete